jgi:hypothetical protein
MPTDSPFLPRRLVDLRVLGARSLPSRTLVRLVAGSGPDDDAIDTATAALHLADPAREAVLLESSVGPRLLAALELGRRAAAHRSPAKTRIVGPGDAVAALSSRLVGDGRWWLLALDVRLRVARAVALTVAGAHDDDSQEDRTNDASAANDNVADVTDEDVAVGALQQTLAAACRRLVLVRQVDGPAVATARDAALFVALRGRAAVVGVAALDAVIVGDDGWCSLLRLGCAPTRERRYR